MALFRVPDKVDRLWNEWNLRGAVLFSLFLQVFFIFSAPSRKRTNKRWIISLIWLAYLLADWVAVFAIGLISSNIGGGQGGNCDKLGVSKDLAGFWAPFLLLHLGGPDTITAFSQEDNELWLRHLVGLVFQLAAVVYVISQSVPNEFWIPTLFLFFAGAIKYAERIRALFLACLGNFKDFYSLSEIYSNKEPISDLEVVQHGNTCFNLLLRGVIIDHMPDVEDHYQIQQYFIERTCADSFRIMEVELNFMYDVLYTKMEVVHNKTGYIFRFVCSVLIVISFQQFAASHHSNKHKLIHVRGGGGIDIVVTYTLLIGAVVLDLVSLLMLIFSDWTLALVLLEKKNTITREHASSIIFDIRKRLIQILLIDKRWCQSVSQFSLISYSLAEQQSSSWLDKMTNFFGLKDFLDEMQYVKTKSVEDGLKEFIFTELKNKAKKGAKENIISARGNWTLKGYESYLGDHYHSMARTVSEHVEYDESLLIWHIATELCYSRDGCENDDREYCKILSEYLLCLLFTKPTLVANTPQLRFRETCQNAKSDIPYNDLSHACEFLLSEYGLSHTALRGSKSVLLSACKLADVLLRLEDKKKRWEIMGKVWVELLCFGASHSRGRAHAQQLSNGGELITFIWLLMAHFAFGEQFREIIN